MAGYIYLMAGRGGMTKIGVSKSVRDRELQVRESTPGGANVIISLPFFFPYVCEAVMHALSAFAHAPKRYGSGRTEWFGLSLAEAILISSVGYLALTAIMSVPATDAVWVSVAAAAATAVIIRTYILCIFFSVFVAEKSVAVACIWLLCDIFTL